MKEIFLSEVISGFSGIGPIENMRTRVFAP